MFHTFYTRRVDMYHVHYQTCAIVLSFGHGDCNDVVNTSLSCHYCNYFLASTYKHGSCNAMEMAMGFSGFNRNSSS